ncbi:MAG: carboxypeptidase-like regulatory domain-containing protein [Candidatus Sericytochromatia bacterium]|nr:carboxypeptidase-like regulatory domain-containing protein [Candidatus Sericytochromatia bacterium]
MSAFRSLRPIAWLATGLSLAACAAPAATPTGPGTPGASQAPASAPPDNATPSPAPSGAPAGDAASAAPSQAVAPSAAPGQVGIVQGRVFTAKGAAVPDGTRVEVTSLDEATPYTGSTTTAGGSYALNDVPYFVQVAVTASRPGWTSRRQVVVFRPRDVRAATANVLDFGAGVTGAATEQAQAAAPYFLSDRPEITRVSPADADASLPNDEMRFTLTLSEPLDAENRRRLAAAFRLVPNNAEALADDQPLPAEVAGVEELAELRVATATVGALELPYSYQQNSAFMNGAELAEFTWDEAGTEATFRLKAPVKTGRTDGAEYAFLLVQRGDTPIRDASGLALGTDLDGEPGATRDGGLILNAIAEPGLTLPVSVLGEDDRWNETHLSFTRFQVATDDEAPRLEKVLARRGYADDLGEAVDRVELTFSEPMLAFPRLTAPGTLRLDSYMLATAADEDALPSPEAMRRAAGVSLAGGTGGAAVRDALAGGATVRVDSAQAVAGNFGLTFAIKDARVVVLTLPVGSLPYDAEVLRVRAGADGPTAGRELADPAGNAVAASGDVATGAIQ